MRIVKVTGWERGLRKISLTKLLQESAGKSLPDAKGLVDALLEGKSFEVSFADEGLARRFADQARSLGAKIVEPTADD
jgi:hypothetical protein